MPIQDFKLDNGLQVSGSAKFASSVSSSGGFTGSLFGTASRSDLLDGYDSSEFALTASTNYFKATQIVSGSLTVTASLTASSLTGTDLNIDYIDFVPQPNGTPPAQQVGRVFVDDLYNEVNTWTDVTGVKLLQGQQLVLRAKCTGMATFTKGTVVRINGGTGANATFVTASWENDTNSADTLGFLMNSGETNDFAYIIINGYLTDINTDGYIPGQTLYLSSSGNYTNVAPSYPYHEVRLGQVVRAHANVGSIFVRVQNGYELGELHDVYTGSLSPGDLLVYEDGVNAQWTNKKQLTGSYQLTGGLNVSGNLSASTITGTFSGLMNGVATVAAGTNLTSSLAGGSLVLNLTSSITSGLNNISGSNLAITALTVTGSTGLSGALGTFNTLTSSNDALVNSIRVGRGAGNVSTNVVLGNTALVSNTSGDNNTAIGHNALTNNTIGNKNIAIGSYVASGMANGSENVIIGQGAAYDSAGLSRTVFIGLEAGRFNSTTGSVAIGHYALKNGPLVGDKSNIAIGERSLYQHTDGKENIAIGTNTGYSLRSGSYNVSVGYNSLTVADDYTYYTGSGNTSIGNSALRSLTNASNNTAVGYNSLTNFKTGSSNIAIGYNVATNVVTGSNNVYIGSYAGVNDVNNNIYLSDGAGNLRMQINDSGLVNIPGALTVSGNIILGDTTTDTVTLTAATMSLGSGTGLLNIDSNTLYVNGNLNKVGFGTSNIATSAIVEMSGTSLGLLFPRVSGSARATMTPVAGLIVYQTDTSGSDAEGLYICKSSGWIQII